MRRFLIQFSLLAIAYLVFACSASWVLCHCGFNPARDSELADLKLEHAKSLGADLVFVGSSRVHRHFNPQIVENSLTRKHEVYNLGVPGMWPPRQDRYVNRAINELSAKVILVELNGPISLSTNFRSAETLRSISPASVNDAIAIKLESSGSSMGKGRLIASYCAATAYKYLGIGLARSEYFKYDPAKVESAQERIDASCKGFLSLDVEAKFSTAVQQRIKPTLDELQSRTEQNEKKYNTSSKLSQTLIDSCNQLIARAKQKNCHLIFMLSPRLVSPQLEIVHPVFQNLPVENKIDMSDPRKYPEFYQLSNSFDPGHMNEQGASKFSQAITGELNKQFGVAIDQNNQTGIGD